MEEMGEGNDKCANCERHERCERNAIEMGKKWERNGRRESKKVVIQKGDGKERERVGEGDEEKGLWKKIWENDNGKGKI